MNTATVTFAPHNIRQVDGCDSDAAVDAVEAASLAAAEHFAERHGLALKWGSLPKHEARGHTFDVVVCGEEDDPYVDEWTLAEDLEDVLERASDEAIQAGEWEDAA